MTAPPANDVSIRRVRPSDQPALRDFYARLSADSRRARFLGGSHGLSAEQSLSFCTPDHMHAEGFVAVSERAVGRGTLVGHLCLEPAAGRSLELALAVADAEQGRGIGRALFEAALAWAAERGYAAITASCMVGNTRVLRLLSSAPYPAVTSYADAGVVNVVVPLAPEMPAEWRAVVPGAVRSTRRRAGRSGAAVSRPCHAVWRRTPPPAPGAEG